MPEFPNTPVESLDLSRTTPVDSDDFPMYDPNDPYAIRALNAQSDAMEAVRLTPAENARASMGMGDNPFQALENIKLTDDRKPVAVSDEIISLVELRNEVARLSRMVEGQGNALNFLCQHATFLSQTFAQLQKAASQMNGPFGKMAGKFLGGS